MSHIYIEPKLQHGSQDFTEETRLNHSTFPIGGSKCTLTIQDVSQTVRDHIVPLYNSTKDLWLPATPSLVRDIVNGGPGSEIYANLYPPDRPRPPDVLSQLPEIKEGGRMRKADFERAKREGKIVLQKRRIAKLQSVVSPGIQRSDLSQKTMVRLKRGRPGTFPRGYSVPCDYTGIACSNPPCILSSSTVSHSVENNNGVLYSRYMWDGDWKYPSMATVKGMMELLQESILTTPLNTSVVTSALAEANNKYWDILTELAELPELIRYIFDGLKEILNLTKTFKKARRDLLKKGGALTELSNLWLQYRYAIMPIVYSVEDAFEYLTTPSTLFVSTRKRVDSVLDLPEIPGWTSDGELTIRQRCFLKRKFDLSVSDSTFLTLNPLLTGWEKVTLSFVVDWVVNVGDFLAALVPPSGIEEEGCLYSHQVPKGTQVVYTSTNHYGMSVAINVGVYDAYPIKPLANIGITFDPYMDRMRWLDAIALSWNIFLKGYFNR